MNGASQLNSINDFGKFALDAYVEIKCIDELEKFIIGVKNNDIKIKKGHHNFYDLHITPLYLSGNPTEKIVNILKSNILKII